MPDEVSSLASQPSRPDPLDAASRGPAQRPSFQPDPRAPTRIVAVDALRGFALLGIVIVHMVEQYLAAPPPGAWKDFGVFSTADRVAQGVDWLLFVGKFFPIFALLFGVSFVIQTQRAAARGLPYSARFVWRLIVLLGLGLCHHALYRGDILSIYALLGLPLVLFVRASDRVLLGTALLLALGVPRALTLAWGAATGASSAVAIPGGPELDAYFAALQSGDLRELAWRNLREGFAFKMDIQLGVFGRGYQTFALFLAGLYLARHGWHETLADRRPQLRRIVRCGLGMSVAAALLLAGVGALLGAPSSPEAITRVQAFAFLTLLDLFNLGLAGALAAGFLLLHLRQRPGRWLGRLAPVGQTALTVYVCQSVIGTWLLYGHGLGLVGRIGAATAMGLAIVLFAVQMVIAPVWLQYFRYGPLEWLWRSITNLQAAPVRAARRPVEA
jgi:uncharacterized protein